MPVTIYLRYCHAAALALHYLCRQILLNKDYCCVFTFQQFSIDDTHCAMKVGTDGVVLGAWAALDTNCRVLDLGCGSGLITLMAAQRMPQGVVTGIEIDPAAADDAAANAMRSPFGDRVRIVCEDVLHYEAPEGLFDHIISNPPYHEEELLPPESARAKARHTDGGLSFAALLHAVDHLLDRTATVARFSLILPTPAVTRFVALATGHGLHLSRRTDLITREGKMPKRTLLELSPHDRPHVTHDTLILTGTDGRRSEAYEQLCRDFYLRKG